MSKVIEVMTLDFSHPGLLISALWIGAVILSLSRAERWPHYLGLLILWVTFFGLFQPFARKVIKIFIREEPSFLGPLTGVVVLVYLFAALFWWLRIRHCYIMPWRRRYLFEQSMPNDWPPRREP